MTKFSMTQDNPNGASFRIAAVETAAQAIAGLQPGSRIIGITKGQFSLLDLIRAVIRVTGPVHMAISTWTAGIRDLENAAWLISTGDLLSLRFYVDRRFAQNHANYCRRLLELFGRDAVRASRKFATLRNASWNVAVRGSMNLNRNTQIEQFDLDDSAQVCDFFDSVMDEAWEHVEPGAFVTNVQADNAFELALQTAPRPEFVIAAIEAAKSAEASRSPALRLAALGYSRAEIEGRIAAEPTADDVQRGRWDLADSHRRSVISTAESGDSKAIAIVSGWLSVIE